MGADGLLGTHLAPERYEVLALNHRLARADAKHEWRMGVRLGPYASGGYHWTPPDLRKPTVQELLTSVFAPGRLAFRRPLADDVLGFSRTGFQGSKAALNQSEAEGSLRVLPVWTTSRAHTATNLSVS